MADHHSLGKPGRPRGVDKAHAMAAALLAQARLQGLVRALGAPEGQQLVPLQNLADAPVRSPQVGGRLHAPDHDGLETWELLNLGGDPVELHLRVQHHHRRPRVGHLVLDLVRSVRHVDARELGAAGHGSVSTDDPLGGVVAKDGHGTEPFNAQGHEGLRRQVYVPVKRSIRPLRPVFPRKRRCNSWRLRLGERPLDREDNLVRWALLTEHLQKLAPRPVPLLRLGEEARLRIPDGVLIIGQDTKVLPLLVGHHLRYRAGSGRQHVPREHAEPLWSSLGRGREQAEPAQGPLGHLQPPRAPRSRVAEGGNRGPPAA
mmetsp:Transcript_56528/g.161080  ORF Transcript_56528/g.161080 Transcript_56528/m.161080 type:complete len:316 (+) Transcript_56528:1599-2546(+)